MPLVSVVIPNYNHARYLERRLESVLNQSVQDIEVLFLDDASTDRSREVFESLADDPRIRSIWNQQNSGSPFAQWNKGVEAATGKYVWLAESDDYADPQLLAALVEQLEKNASVGVAGCDSWVVDDAGSPSGRISDWLNELAPGRWHSDYVNEGSNEGARFMAFRNTIPNASGAVFRRDTYLQTGGANPAMRLAGDWLLWAKMLQRSDVAYVARPLNFFRTHPGSARDNSIYSGARTREKYLVTQYILEHFEVEPAVREQACQALASEWLDVLVAFKGAKARTQAASIYKQARCIDDKVMSRLLKRLPKCFMAKVRRKSLPVPQRLESKTNPTVAPGNGAKSEMADHLS